MKLTVILLLTSLHAQTLPQNWAGFGGSINQSSTPPVAGWYSYATLLSQSAKIYSFTTNDIFLSSQKPHTIQTSTRSGLATVLRQFGPITILGLGDAGMVAGGTSIGGAYSGGGMGLVRLGKGTWTLAAGARVIKTSTGGSRDVYEIGIGRTF